MVDLIWFHFELDLPDLLDFPLYLLPSTQMEETPKAHAAYQRQLAEIISLNPWKSGDEEEPEGIELQGLDGIEPEFGLINWCQEVLNLVSRFAGQSSN